MSFFYIVYAQTSLILSCSALSSFVQSTELNSKEKGEKDEKGSYLHVLHFRIFRPKLVLTHGIIFFYYYNTNAWEYKEKNKTVPLL